MPFGISKSYGKYDTHETSTSPSKLQRAVLQVNCNFLSTLQAASYPPTRPVLTAEYSFGYVMFLNPKVGEELAEPCGIIQLPDSSDNVVFFCTDNL